jgi:DNA-binding GntR family transcriptional regulator
MRDIPLRPRRHHAVTPQLQQLNVRPEPVSAIVYAALRDAIVDKTLPPGSAVSEANLARELNVSKTPVREALLRLRELHLVEPDGARGLRVIRPSGDAITEAYEARWALESAAASLAATRADAEQQAALRDAADESVRRAEANDSTGFRESDRQFHATIAEAAASTRLTALAKNALLLTDVLRARDVPISGDSVRCSYEHVAIADAICEGDGRRAGELAGVHVMHVLSNVLAAFTPATDDAAEASE